jgi:hypothetical protein
VRKIAVRRTTEDPESIANRFRFGCLPAGRHRQACRDNDVRREPSQPSRGTMPSRRVHGAPSLSEIRAGGVDRQHSSGPVCQRIPYHPSAHLATNRGPYWSWCVPGVSATDGGCEYNNMPIPRIEWRGTSERRFLDRYLYLRMATEWKGITFTSTASCVWTGAASTCWSPTSSPLGPKGSKPVSSRRSGSGRCGTPGCISTKARGPRQYFLWADAGRWRRPTSPANDPP